MKKYTCYVISIIATSSITVQPEQSIVEKRWGKGKDLKILRFYNLLLVFDDLFGCLGQEKDGVKNYAQLFGLEDWVDNVY